MNILKIFNHKTKAQKYILLLPLLTSSKRRKGKIKNTNIREKINKIYEKLLIFFTMI
jgi:hypothetical protein